MSERRIGPQLKAFIEERGITGYKLAKMTGLNQKTVYGWLKPNANPGAENLRKVADALGVSVDEILGQITNGHPIEADREPTEAIDATHACVRLVGDYENEDAEIHNKICEALHLLCIEDKKNLLRIVERFAFGPDDGSRRTSEYMHRSGTSNHPTQKRDAS